MLPRLVICIQQIVAPVLHSLSKELRQSESVDFDDLIMLTLRLFDQVLMCDLLSSRSSSTFMLMSTKIPTMPSINWSNSWLHALKHLRGR